MGDRSSAQTDQAVEDLSAPPRSAAAGDLPTVPAISPSPAHRRGRQRGWLSRGVAPYLLAGDVLAFVLATLITHPGSPLHVVSLLVTIFTFQVAGLYRSRLSLSLLDDFPYIVAAMLVALTLKVTLFALVSGVDRPQRQLYHALVLFFMVSAWRWFAYAVVRAARTRGLVSHRAIIVGAGELGARLGQTLLERRDYGVTPVGFVDSHPPAPPLTMPQIPVLGRSEDLGRIIVEHRIRDVIVAYGGADESDLVDILRTCDGLDVQVFLVPRLFELHIQNRDTDDVNGIPLIRSRGSVFQRQSWKVKRLIDITVAGLALLVLSPVLAACAIAVRYEGGRGVIFRQVRVGLDGRPFEILKFRSLRPVDETESRTNWNIKHDDRLGPVGKFMRRASLDELPQLWNILRGDMSLVGPRPERPHFVEQFSVHIPRYTSRHRVPAGLTGWAQAHGLRGDTSIEDRARFDNYYIENWSPWLDTKIVLKTIGQVLRRQGG